MSAKTTTRIALIPGGAKGIGRRIGADLAQRGWSVAIAYRTSRDAAEEAVGQIEAAGGKGLALAADVSRPDECERLVKGVVAWQGQVDALVNCAGPFHRVDFFSETPEGWREMFASNLDSLFFLSRLVAQPQLTAHYLAKVGVLGLVRTLSKSLARHHITVNAISPGFIDSGSMGEEELKAVSRNIPAGYVGSTADTSSVALYLLSDEAAYVTGANIPVSGGWGW